MADETTDTMNITGNLIPETPATGIKWPETDEEAQIQIKRIFVTPGVAETLQGLYRCRRGLGDDVTTAFDSICRSYTDACNIRMPE